jgi:hypothetical protein
VNRRHIRTGCTAALVLLVAGCTGTAPPTWRAVPALSSSVASSVAAADISAIDIPATASPAGLINPGSVDTTNPQAVALAVVITLHRWDTRIDTAPSAAARRAAPWMTPALTADLTAVPTTTDSSWLDLETHDGYTDLIATIADEYGQPPNTADIAYVQVTYTVTLHGRDGWRNSQPSTLDRVELIRPDGAVPWRVKGFH